MSPAGVAPAIYDVTVTHRRRERVDHAFTTRSYLWLVDLDDLPVLPLPLRPLARFRAADHLDGDPARSIRAGVDALLADHGIDLRGGRVLMLAHARVLGHVFNPLSLYWCHDPDGALVCVVAEVHNTYGGRHHYLLDVDAAGRARVDKDFYVSPFFTVDGEYRMRVPEPGATLEVGVGLRREGTTVFAASVRGRRRDAGVRGVLRAALRHPMAPLAGAAAIRRQGITLWAKGVPVVPRPARDTAPARRDGRAPRSACSPDRRVPRDDPRIRTAGADDVDALLELVHAAYRGHGGEVGWTTEAELIDGPRTTRALLAADVADPAITVLVAGEGDACAGCAAVTHRAGEALASFGMFAVRPAGQGAGLGRTLLAAAEEHARSGGAATMEMCVIDRRTELIAWYERRGYRRTGETRPFPYGAPGVGEPRGADFRFAVLVKALALD